MTNMNVMRETSSSHDGGYTQAAEVIRFNGDDINTRHVMLSIYLYVCTYRNTNNI